MHFTPFYDIEFSKDLIVFDPNRMSHLTPYTYAVNADKQPVIHVNIGKGSVNMILDSGADLNEVISDMANAVGLRNYPWVNIQTEEAIGKVRNSPHEIISGYKVPVTIPGAYSGRKTIYISDIRKSKLNLLSDKSRNS